MKRYDYENVDSASASSMMKHLRDICNDVDGLKKKQFASYQIENMDDFRYQDPIDESVTEKQVCLLFFLKKYIIFVPENMNC